MDTKIAGLLGAAAVLVTAGGAPAAAPVPGTGLVPAANYKDLLDPFPNALAALKADDARLAARSTAGEMQIAQYHHHHHHHHHHVIPRVIRRFIRPRHHHHHHHHHHGYFRG